jgi:hypothetical protein
MNCPSCKIKMYEHKHVPEVFSVTDTTVTALHGCPQCFLTAIVRLHKPVEFLHGANA